MCSRDNARTPFQWDKSEYAGFSKCKPWIKVNANKSYINAEDEIADEDSVLNYYKKLIAFRKGNKVIKEGEYIDLLPRDRNIFMYKRKSEVGEVIVLSSFSKEKVKFKRNDLLEGYELVLTNYKENEKDYLKPYETRLYKKGF